MNYVAVCLKAAKMLREMEWMPVWHHDDSCPRCGALSGSHRIDCALSALIRELEATEGTADKVQRIDQAHGTCPHCGYWNHPAATAYDGNMGLVFCNNCQETWQQEHDGSEAPR